MLAANLERERKNIYQKGKAAGLARGRMKVQKETIGLLLQFRFELTEIEKLQYEQQVELVQKLPHMNKLFNTLLNNTTTLEDFSRLLAQYLLLERIG